MLSTCPSCLSQVTHAEHLFDVTCECGTHFSPFLHPDSGGEKDPNSFSRYAESASAFADIVSFGESTEGDNQALIVASTPPEILSTSEEREVPPTTEMAFPPLNEAFLMTPGNIFQGYSIDAYLAPISTWAPVNASENPLKQAFSIVWELARKQEGNAVLGLDWKFSPDGQRVLLSAVPVRVSKTS